MPCAGGGGVYVGENITVEEEGELHIQNSRAKLSGGLRQRIISGWPRDMFPHACCPCILWVGAKYPRSVRCPLQGGVSAKTMVVSGGRVDTRNATAKQRGGCPLPSIVERSCVVHSVETCWDHWRFLAVYGRNEIAHRLRVRSSAIKVGR